MVGRRDLLKRAPAAGVALAIGGGTALMASTQAQAEDPARSIALLVLDRSGSMCTCYLEVARQIMNAAPSTRTATAAAAPQKSGHSNKCLVNATVDGVNKVIEENRNVPGMVIGVIQFDSVIGVNIDVTRDFESAETIELLKPGEFEPRGGTPLLAGFAEGIARLDKVMRPQDKALLIVQTDGHENSSPAEITKAVVQSLKKSKETLGNWTFAFMGAGVDAWGEGGGMGIGAGSSFQYANTHVGTRTAYAATATATNTWATNIATANANFYTDPATAQAIKIKLEDTDDSTEP